MLSHVDRIINWYSIDYFIFEQVAAQRWFLQQPEFESFRRKTQVLAHNTGRNKGDPTLGVGSLAMDFEFGNIRLPYGDPEAKQMSELLIDEAMSYPEGETDDLLMALWFIKFNFARLVPRNYPSSGQQGGNVPPRLANGWAWMQKEQPKWPVSV
jgi:hypothetical protein